MSSLSHYAQLCHIFEAFRRSESMEHLMIYLGLVSACWSILLRPHLVFYQVFHRPKLGLQINNMFLTFGQANFYTMPTMLAYVLPSSIYAHGQAPARYNFNWVFMLPYALHCVHNYVDSLQKMFRLMAMPPALAAENYISMQAKIILVIVMQLLSMLEICFIFYYGLRKMSQNGERLY